MPYLFLSLGQSTPSFITIFKQQKFMYVSLRLVFVRHAHNEKEMLRNTSGLVMIDKL